MDLDHLLDKGQAVPGAGLLPDVFTPVAVIEYLRHLSFAQMRAGGIDVELDACLTRPEVIGQHLPAVGHGLLGLSVLVNKGLGVFRGIGKKVVVDLGQQTHVHHDGEFLLQHVVGLLNGNATRLKTAAVIIELRRNDLFFHITGLGPKHKMSLAEMVTSEQAFQAQGIAGMMTLQIMMQTHEVLLHGIDVKKQFIAFLAYRVACFTKRLQPLAQAFYLTYFLFQPVEQMPEIDVWNKDIVLYVPHQIVDEFQVVDVLPGDHPVVQIKTDAVGVLQQKKPVILGKPLQGKDLEHAQD